MDFPKTFFVGLGVTLDRFRLLTILGKSIGLTLNSPSLIERYTVLMEGITFSGCFSR